MKDRLNKTENILSYLIRFNDDVHYYLIKLFHFQIKLLLRIKMEFLTIMELFFLLFTKMGPFKKKITNLGKSCQFDTTSYAQIVTIRHDFAMSY